jgi:hypothetical protein
MRHLVNTFLDGGESAEKKWLEPLLAASIKDAPFRLRLSHDVTKLLHALAKCLGEGIGLYGRGEGASKFRPWLEKNHKGKLYWHLSRVDKGTRQDSKTEGAFAAYWNRPLNVAYLQTAAYGASDLLKDNLFVMLSSLEIVATMRGRAAYHDKFTAPLRFFSASNDLDGWSSLDMAQVGVARVRRASPARGV